MLAAATTSLASAQDHDKANYDEAKIAAYSLPPLLVCKDGTEVKTAEQWTGKRRAEVLDLYRDTEFGRNPVIDDTPKFEVISSKEDALGGLATRRLVRITLPKYPQWQGIDMMLYIPNQPKGKAAPVFVGLSFGGNHAVSKETDVPLSTRWMRPSKEKHIVDNRATEATRGTESSRWPLEMIMKSGYAVATAYYGDIEPDDKDGWKTGLRAAISKDGANTEWKANDWGAIAAWAWGISRMLDYCEKDIAIDPHHAAVIGHSRLGKTSLWAGAQDERFGFVISNNSGEGGAAITRRNFGETNKRITTSFPHWFCKTYGTYADRVNDLPIDQHMLIALAAPRAVYIASAEEDTWADPRGEFLSGKHAGEVYALFGKKGVGVEEWPPVNQPVGDSIGYHIRTGKHDVTDYDWEQYLKFADRHFQR